MALEVRAKHTALPGIIRVQQIHDRSIFDEDRLEQQQWLRHHVHAGPISIVVEIREHLRISDRCYQPIQLQPLTGKIVAETTRSAAARGGSIEVVTMLLDGGSNPNMTERTFHNGGALFCACSLGHFEIAKLLLDRGANPDGPCESSGTSIAHAATQEIRDLLLARGSSGKRSPPDRDIRQEILCGRTRQGENGFDPLLARIIWSNDSELLALYIETYGNDNLTRLFPGSGPGGWFVPKEATASFLDDLIAAGFDINRPSWVGRTHLHFLAGRNMCVTARRLIERGANVDFVSLESGTTPLGSGAERGHQEMVRLLLDQGANPSLLLECPSLRPRALADRRGHKQIAAMLDTQGEKP